MGAKIPPIISAAVEKDPPPKSKRDTFEGLIRLLEDPREEWYEIYRTWDHRSGVQIWPGFILIDWNTHPVPMKLSLFQKWRLRRAVIRSRHNQLARKLGL